MSRLRRLWRTATARRQLRRARAQARAGRLHSALDLADAAVQALQADVARPSGPDPVELIVAHNDLADLLLQATLLDRAVHQLDAALTLIEAQGNAAAAALQGLQSDTLLRRGHVRRLQARWEQAGADLSAALRTAPDELRRAGVHNALGILSKDTGEFARAEQHYRAAEQLLTSCQGPDSPMLAALEHNLAGLAHARNAPAAGLPHIHRALSLRADTQGGPDPADVLSDRSVLVALLAAEGRHVAAEVLVRELIDQWTQLRGPQHYEVGHCRHHLAAILDARGEATAASEQYELARRILQDVLGPSHPEVLALERAP